MTLSCGASGIPLPNVTWEKEGGATPPTTTVLNTPSGTPSSVSDRYYLTKGVTIAFILLAKYYEYITLDSHQGHIDS